MKILTIIISYNFEEWIERCLTSLQHSEQPCSVLVIDNASQDQTVTLIKKNYPEVRLIENKQNAGFGRANNQGMQIALQEGYDAVFLLNQDAWIAPQTLGTLCTLAMQHPEYGVLSPTHLTGDGSCLDPGFAEYATHSTQQTADGDLLECPFINAAFWFIPVSVLNHIGGFSPLFYHYGEDKDYINRLHYHGYKLAYSPHVNGWHDRAYRAVTPKAFYHAEYVYHLSEYANLNYSFTKAFAYSILAIGKKSGKKLLKGEFAEAGAYLKLGGRLLSLSKRVANTRAQNQIVQPNYIQP